MAHGDARKGNWSGNWQTEWVASSLHTTSEHGVSSITTADAHNSAASSRLNWRPPGRFKWTRPFRRKTKSGFWACAITFQLASTRVYDVNTNNNGLRDSLQKELFQSVNKYGLQRGWRCHHTPCSNAAIRWSCIQPNTLYYIILRTRVYIPLGSGTSLATDHKFRAENKVLSRWQEW